LAAQIEFIRGARVLMLQRCHRVVNSCRRASSLCRGVAVTAVLMALAVEASAQPVESRAAILARAQVWRPTDVSTMDLKRGPRLPGVLEPETTVHCDFVDRTLDGKSPKFACTLANNEEVKVKFGEANPEVPGEVAATRLLWALGFGADVMYPVRVVCRGCPEHISTRTLGPRERLVDPAAIERKMPARAIPGTSEAWSWPELDLIREEAGGAPVAHRDALKLLAVFLQHTDSKPEQQRLVCLDDEGSPAERCERPFMIMNDVGLTFGRANLANTNRLGVNLREWSQTPVWKDGAPCVGNLPRSLTGTLKDPVISEDGREFLANLLAQLSDTQIHDMFEAARVDADAWTRAFKAKRQEILDRRCDVLWPGGISALFGTAPVRGLQEQASTPLTVVMNAISLLGYTRVYVAIAIALAFLVRLRAGAALLLLLALNGVLTDGAKAIVSAPRPDAIDDRVQTLDFIATLGDSFGSDSPFPSVDADDGYGFPSGHVAAATAFLFGLMYLFQWPWIWRAMVFWIPAMALARLYLGRHFLGDVLGGVGVGVIAATIGFLALTLARLSNPSRAWTAVGRTIVAAAGCVALALMFGVPAAYDTGRFLGLAIGAACVVAYVGPRFAPDSDVTVGARLASVVLAAVVFGMSWWATRAILDAADIGATPVGGLLAGGLPMLLVLPLPLYLTDRFVVPRTSRVNVSLK
jgi:membrane-associated phospholipid phosphatase